MQRGLHEVSPAVSVEPVLTSRGHWKKNKWKDKLRLVLWLILLKHTQKKKDKIQLSLTMLVITDWLQGRMSKGLENENWNIRCKVMNDVGKQNEKRTLTQLNTQKMINEANALWLSTLVGYFGSFTPAFNSALPGRWCIYNSPPKRWWFAVLSMNHLAVQQWVLKSQMWGRCRCSLDIFPRYIEVMKPPQQHCRCFRDDRGFGLIFESLFEILSLECQIFWNAPPPFFLNLLQNWFISGVFPSSVITDWTAQIQQQLDYIRSGMCQNTPKLWFLETLLW